jgi:HD-like signal output (HDOD) protein
MAGVRRRIRTGHISLPAPPRAIVAIAAAVRDPAIGEDPIASAIRADASLTVHVVRASLELATQRAPGKAHHPEGLLRAVQRLGPRRLLSIAVAHTKRRSHRAFQLTEIEGLSQRLARRTERTAEAVHILAELLGRDCPLEDRAEVHVAELGEGLLLHAVESALLDGVPLPDPKTVRHELARHHAAFGAAAADQWGLGDRLRNLIRRHHEPDPIERLGAHPLLRDTVFLQALGRATVRRAMAAPALESSGPQIEECLAVLGLSRGGFDAAVERLKSHLQGSRLAA